MVERYQNSLDCPSRAVDRKTFCMLFDDFPSPDHARQAFAALNPSKKGCVDACTVFAAMAAVSDQCFISRMSLLFSIFDLDGNGTLNKAELYIGMRSLFIGLHAFYGNTELPTKAELEEAVNEVFAQIDYDKSGSLTIGEFLVFAYRCRPLQEMIAKLEFENQEVHENVVPFNRFGATGEETSRVSPRPSLFIDEPGGLPGASQQRQSSVRTSTAAGRRQSRNGAMKPSSMRSTVPSDMTKAKAWLLWKFFEKLAIGEDTIEADDLRNVLKDDKAAKAQLVGITEQAKLTGEPVAAGEGAKEDAEHVRIRGIGVLDFAREVEELSKIMLRALQAGESQNRLALLGSCPVSLRSFLCVTLPLSPPHVEACIGWCISFKAAEVLKAVFSDKVPREKDLELLFKVLDADQNNSLALDELVEMGHIPKEQAEEFFKGMDRNGSGDIDMAELKKHVASKALKTSLR